MTTETNTPDTVPANHIDLDSTETQKILDDAFQQALGKDVPAATVEVTPPAVEAEEPKDTVPEKKDDKEKEEPVVTTPVVAEDKKETSSTTNTPAEASIEGIPDWAKDLPKHIQEKVFGTIQEARYHQQRWRSDVGRQNALQAKLTETRRELANLRNQVIKPQDPALAAATQGDHSKTLEEWNQVIEADPTLAKAIELRIKAEVNQAKAELTSQIDANVDPLYQHTMQTVVDDQNRILHEAVPNVDEVLQSPVYHYWVQRHAAPGIRNLIENSTEAADAINVLRVYANEAPMVYQEMINKGFIQAPQNVPNAQAAQPPQQMAHNGQGTPDTSLADKVAKTREQKVHTAPVVPTAPVAAPTTSMATTLATSKPGQSIDLDDAYVQKTLEDAYNQYRRK